MSAARTKATVDDDVEDPAPIGRDVRYRAKQIGVSPSHIYNEINRGRLVLTRFGRTSCVLDHHWRSYLDLCSMGSPAGQPQSSGRQY